MQADENDVLIVAAGLAYEEYVQYGAYVGHSGRPFRDGVRWMAFYVEGEIKPEVPEILHIESSVTFSHESASRYEQQGDEFAQRVGRLIRTLLDRGVREPSASLDVILLSSTEDGRTVKLSNPIEGDKVDRSGKPIPVTYGQYRYTSLARLQSEPATTSELGL